MLAIRRVRRPLLGATIGRLPFAGMGFAVVLMVKGSTGSFAEAGLVQAMYALGEAAGLPIQGRLVDRVGQTRVMAACAVVCAASVAALTALAGAGAAVPVLAATAAVGGLFFPPFGTGMRTLLSGLIPDRSLRESAFALDAVNVEVSFILGPLVTGIVIGFGSPSAAVLTNAALMLIGVAVFALSAASRDWRGTSHELGLLGPLRTRGVLVLMSVGLGFGAAVGAIELGITALASDEGHRQAAGALIAVQAAGSMAGGFWYGSRTWSGPAAARLPLLATALALSTVPLVVAPSLAIAFPLMLVSGIAFAPTITAMYALLDQIAPEGTATEATGWILTAIVIGIALGTGAAGAAVGGADYHAGLAVGLAGGALTAACAWAGRGALARAEPRTDP